MRSFLRHIHPVTIPDGAEQFRYTWCMGGIAAMFFLVELATGVLLMFHYHPDPSMAYGDIVTIQEVVPFGDRIRTAHRLASHGLILAVFLHMLRVFLTGAYQSPRRLNWLVGVSLLILTMAIAFTGYVLPWNETAYRAATVGLNLAGIDASPESALLPCYVLHCVALPVAMTLLMGYHFWKVRKDGGISGPL
ncbi:MAG: cytochrome b N-terminal domain-containing protein [Planctomycetia bacterium]|nr:cytochrome b N-terminal domain-containing protein [Planctomycetia bacterium]